MKHTIWKQHKKRLIVSGIVAVLLGGTAFGIFQMQKKASLLNVDLTAADTASIEKRDLVESVSATGTITSVRQQSAAASVTGVKVTAVNVKVGDLVQKGDVLVLLDASDLKYDLADAKNSLNAAKAKGQIDLNAAKRSLAEAEAERSIEIERANEDAATAWNSYKKAVGELSQAEQDYQNAWSDSEEARIAFQNQSDALAAAEVFEYTGTSSEDCQDAFDDARDDLKKLIYALDDPSWNVDRNIRLTTDFSTLRMADIIGTSTNADQEKIQALLRELEAHQKDYQEAKANEDEAARSASRYQELKADTSELEANYKSAAAELEQKEAVIRSAEASAESALDAYRQKVRGQNDSVRNGSSSVNSKKDSLALSGIGDASSTQTEEKSIRTYEKQIDDCTVRAAISGVVTSLSVSKGDLYSGGEIIKIEDESDYEISTEIDEYDIAKIKVGQDVVIKTNATKDAELSGQVKEIAPRATKQEGTNKNVTYTVIISVDPEDYSLKMDMTAKLSIILSKKAEALSVPYDAVQEDDQGFYIELPRDLTTSEDSKQTEEALPDTEKIYVKKGLESDYYIEILSDRIAEGMTVIVPSSDRSGDSLELVLSNEGAMGGF